MTTRMTARTVARARLLISLVVEPGDPRIVPWLADHDAREVWSMVRGAGKQVPAAWADRAGWAEESVDAVVAAAECTGARWVVPGDRDWPVGLDDLDRAEAIGQAGGAPMGLWVRGGADLLEAMAAPIAIVGARSNTTYGAECAGDIAADCADQGCTIVSGAAFGIDASAHRGALLAGGPTIAVLACGVDVEYPRAHASLLRRIAEEGLVISEYPPGTAPQRHRFLVRNRVIAALSQGVVVVEAAARSGSLNTLNWADHLGRTTMAVPGPVTSQASSGAHRAVRDGKALLVTSGRDVLADCFGGVDDEVLTVGAGAKRVWARLAGTEQGVEQLAAGLRWAPTAVRRALGELERLGVAESGATGWRRTILVGGGEAPADGVSR